MSTEQTEPVSHYGDDGQSAATSDQGQATESGDQQPGSSQGANGGRRRRRRRKNKGPAAQAGPQMQPAGEESIAAAAPIPPPAAPAPAPQGQGFGQGQGGGKRKNRKRSSSGGGGFSQPGNGNGQRSGPRPARQGGWKSRGDGPDGNREGARGGFESELYQGNNGNSGRKGKAGRGPRSFVGPMDHSYRAVNGNVADGPPSTLDYRSGNANGNVNGRNDATEYEPAVAAVREDAPTRIVCFVEDLFIVTKMQETARKMGVKVQFAKADKETLAAITDAPENERPSLIVFDLNNAGAKPLTTIPKLKAKLKRSTSVIGFLQHIQGDLKLKATEAGCDSVMPRSAFSLNMPNLLRRHGFAEEQEMLEA